MLRCHWAISIIFILAWVEVTDGFKSQMFKRISQFKMSKLHNYFNSNDYELLIWDCDGVLVDSEALLKKGEVEALAKIFPDVTMTVDDCVRLFSGVSPDTAAANFLKEKGFALPSDFFKIQIEGSMQLFRDRLEPLMKDTVLSLNDAGVQMCVASGSPRPRVLLCLDVGGMGTCFKANTVFTREEVARGKPAPDLFLHAAERMGVSPSKCIVVEDATAGIQAAQAAGMKVIGYLGAGHAQADWYRKDLTPFDIPITYTQKEVLDILIPLFKKA